MTFFGQCAVGGNRSPVTDRLHVVTQEELKCRFPIARTTAVSELSQHPLEERAAQHAVERVFRSLGGSRLQRRPELFGQRCQRYESSRGSSSLRVARSSVV